MLTMHPAAAALAKVAGLDRAETEEWLFEVACRNPAMLFGGFASDALVVGTMVALKSEALTEGEINERVDEILSCAYAGLI